MKLVDLINYLLNPEKIEELIKKLNLNIDSDAILIYMKGKIDIDSEVAFYEVEETLADLIYEKESVKYVQLFPLNHAIDLIEFDLELKDKGYTDMQIAKRLIEYRLNDA